MRKIDRLDAYIYAMRLNDNKVTVDCGLSVGLLNTIRRKENSDLGSKSIEKILNTYNNLNGKWLMTGEGEMLINEDCKNIGEVKSHDNADAEYWKAKYEECFAELQRQKGISEGLRIALGVSRDATEHSSMVAR